MKRRIFLKALPAAGLIAWIPQRVLTTCGPSGASGRSSKAVENPALVVMGSGSVGLRVIKALRADEVAGEVCLYGSTVKSEAELGSRLLVVFGEREILSWDEREQAIASANALVAVCGLGESGSYLSLPALEELAHIAGQSGQQSTVAVVSLPFDDERRGSRRLWAFEQLRRIRGLYAKVVSVDANRLLPPNSMNVGLENASQALELNMAACVADIRAVLSRAGSV